MTGTQVYNSQNKLRQTLYFFGFASILLYMAGIIQPNSHNREMETHHESDYLHQVTRHQITSRSVQ